MNTKLIKLKLFDFTRFDSRIASILLFAFYFIKYLAVRSIKGRLEALLTAGDMFRHTQFRFCRNYAAGILRKTIRKYGEKTVGSFFLSKCEIDSKLITQFRQSILYSQRPFNKRLIILSPPEKEKKGVLLIKFTIYFVYLSLIFDLNKLFKNYILVLEPSFCGYFNPAILCLMGHSAPIIIQASEKVDYEFIKGLDSNLIPVDIGANYWVDDRVFFPIDNTDKIYDIIMVSLWADFKRHYHLFQALSKCKNRDDIRVCLVGMPWPNSLEDIRGLARYYNVDHCIESFENISQEGVNTLLNKSKACLLLSRKEGFNKSIIESMYADIPVFLLEGFNYGQHYHYINQQTGSFIPSSGLSEFIENVDSTLQNGRFSPNEWISSHITPERTTTKLVALLVEIEGKKDIEINKRLEIKVNNPDCDYKFAEVWEKHKHYYRELTSCLK